MRHYCNLQFFLRRYSDFMRKHENLKNVSNIQTSFSIDISFMLFVENIDLFTV